ncbi:MAG: helix-turn-helix domain-containing protein [Deltaproteobacteria bacterium]|nr:MAG: helix-turn-helix domain-containing protein [Deltaproteobacteria bacterium]
MNDSSSKKSSQTQTITLPNRVQERREALLLSKAELARKAGVSALTIDRVEKGSDCRMDTKRKILLALGLKLSDRKTVFHDDAAEQAEAGSSRHDSNHSNEG